MILAAGLGTRMAPLSGHRPKPLLPLLDEPLVSRMLRQLANQGVESAVLNAHTDVERIRDAVSKCPIPVEISYEAELRGSGGGILAARAWLEGDEPFLVLNADMCIDLDVAALLAAHREHDALVTLLLRDEPRKHDFGTIGYAGGCRVSRITNMVERGTEDGSGLFAGVHVIQPEVFAMMPERTAFGILEDVYVPLLRGGGPIACHLQDSERAWWPVGTPAELLDANLLALHAACDSAGETLLIAEDAHVEGELRGPLWVGRGASVERGAQAGPDAVIGAGATLAAGPPAARALLLPEARPPRAAELSNAIAYGHEVWRDG